MCEVRYIFTVSGKKVEPPRHRTIDKSNLNGFEQSFIHLMPIKLQNQSPNFVENIISWWSY